MIRGLVNYIIPEAQIKGITNQGSEHAFEYRPLYRHHSSASQVLAKIQIRIGQGQNLTWLPLQDLFYEYGRL